jgi:hypothetical protein
MVYSKTKLKSSGDKYLLALNNFGYENYQANVYLNGL